MTMEQLNMAVLNARREHGRLQIREAKLQGQREVLQRKLEAVDAQVQDAANATAAAVQKVLDAERDYRDASLAAVGIVNPESLEDEGPAPLCLRKGDTVEWDDGPGQWGKGAGVFLEVHEDDPRYVCIMAREDDERDVMLFIRARRITNVKRADA